MELYGSIQSISGSMTASVFTGSFKGDGSGLYNIQASGVTGLNLSQIATGSVTASVSPDGFNINSNTSITGSLRVNGTIIAEQIDVTIYSSSVLYQSGSTRFGDTLDDTHNITGSVNITGSISLNGQPIGTGKLDETVFNTYTASANTYTSSNNSRVSALEVSSGSLNSFTSSINTTIKNKLDNDGVISGSIQINITGTTGYSAFSSSIATTDLNQSNRLTSIEAATNSLNNFSYSINTIIKDKINLENVVSSSAQVSITGTNGYTTFSSSIATTDSLQEGRLSSLETASGSLNTFSSSTLSRLTSIETSTSSLNSFSSSTNTRLNSLETASGSIRSDFNTYTSSNNSTNTTQNSRLTALESTTGSLNSYTSSTNTRLGVIESTTSSLNSYTSSTNTRLGVIEGTTGSLNSYTSSTNTRLNTIETATSSLNSFTSSINTTIKNKLNADGVISGSVQVDITQTTNYTSFSASLATTDLNQTNKISAIESTTSSLNTFTSSANGRLNSLESTTGSLNSYTSSNNTRLGVIESTTSSLNSYTASNNTRLGIIESTTSSLNSHTSSTNTRLSNIETSTGSLNSFTSSTNTRLGVIESTTSSLNTYTASNNTRLGVIESTTGSLNIFTSSANGRLNALETASGSIRTDFNTFTSSYTTVSGSLDSRLDVLEAYSSSQQVPTASYAFRTDQTDVYCKNTTGTQINKGQVVRIIGATGDNPLIGLADYSTELNSANVLGIATENIPTGNFGLIITTGILTGVNTQGMAAGDLLYLGTNGAFTNVEPAAPNHIVRLGEVLRVQQNNGSINVRVDNGSELDEAHDVTYTNVSQGDLLVRNNNNVWVNTKSLTGSYSLTGSMIISGSQTVVGTQTVSGSLIVLENLQVFGSSSITYVTASQLALSTSFISVNVFEPAERFGGLKVFDSGSSNATASLAWDSQNNHWIYQNASGSSYSGGMLISGPRNTGSLGQEVGLTSGKIPKSVGGDHIDNSIMNETAGVIYITGSLSATGTVYGTNITAIETTTSSLNSYTASNDSTNTTQNSRLSALETSTSSLNTFTSSAGSRLASIETSTSSLNSFTSSAGARLNNIETSTGSLNSYTSSTNTRLSNIETSTGSLNSYTSSNNIRLNNIETSTGSLNSYTSSTNTRLNSIETSTGSLNSYTSSNNTRLGVIESTTSSLNSYTSSNNTRLSVIESTTSSLNTFTSSANTRLGLIETSTGSLNTFTSSANTRLGLIETSTGSLNSFTNSINTTIKSRLNAENVLSSSAQVVSALPAGTVSGSSQVLNNTTIHSGSFFNGISVVSGSAQIDFNGIINKPTLVSGSSQITYSGLSGIPSGIVSGSSQITYGSISGIPSGIVSGSSQITFGSISGIPSGLVSGSSQITYGSISGIPSGIVSGSSQISFGSISGVPSGLVSGSSQISFGSISGVPSGLVSGSSQIAIASTTGFSTYLDQAVKSGSTVTFNGITNTSTYSGSNIIYSTYNTATGRANLGFSVAKTTIGNIHIQNGSGAGNDNSNQAAITFQGGTSSEAQAGIYVLNNSSYGTSMGFATTNSYATGPQLFMTATNGGVVDFPRARPTYAGNVILDAANYTSYAMAGAGYSANQNLNTTNSPTFVGLTLSGTLNISGGSSGGFTNGTILWASGAGGGIKIDSPGTNLTLGTGWNEKVVLNAGTGVDMYTNNGSGTYTLRFALDRNGNQSITGALSSVGLTNTGAYSGSGGSFSHNIGNPAGTTELFVHNGANTPVPFRMTKAGYTGAGGSYGILQLYMNDNTNGNGSNLYFCANNSSGTFIEYGGIGMQIKSNTASSETARLYFYRQGRAVNGTFDSDGTLYTVGNIYTNGNGTTTGNLVLNSSNYTSYAMQGAGYSANQNLNTNSTVNFGNLRVGSTTTANGSLVNINGGNYNQFNLTYSSTAWGLLMGFGDGSASGGYHGLNHAAIINVQSGPIHFGTANSSNVQISSAGHLHPSSNNTYDCGTSALAWRNVYTNDLHLSNMNKEGGNDVDGTNGNWTIQEGAENLYIINNNNGKKFKISLEEIK